jgi:hypothetical protein
MLAYINIYKPSYSKIPITNFISQLSQNVWGKYSPMDVIQNMNAKKYKIDAAKIRKADLTYPIIILKNKHIIVDGYHRLSNVLIKENSEINAYIFDTSLMKKFIVDKNMNFVKVHQHTNIYDFLQLWSKNFCK